MPEEQSTPQHTCAVEGCGNRKHCRGWCKKHYARWRRHGNPLITHAFKRGLKHGYTTHDGSTAEYTAWQNMKTRCYGTYNCSHRYKGRGITVCKRWLESFENFLADMGDKPEPHYTLERADNDRGYSPCNCYWATPKAQFANKKVRRNASGSFTE